MMNEYTTKVTSDSIHYNDSTLATTLSFPKYTWKCELHPDTFWYVQEGKQPNAFHRFMQRLCFGVKWSRIDESHK